jgi:hypothetical protein
MGLLYALHEVPVVGELDGKTSDMKQITFQQYLLRFVQLAYEVE